MRFEANIIIIFIVFVFSQVNVSRQNYVLVKEYSFNYNNRNNLSDEWVLAKSSCDIPGAAVEEDNLEVDNGKLSINLREENGVVTSSGVDSRRFFKYGKFKIRFKIGEEPTVNFGDLKYDIL
ncbi:MAG: hypothetical protein ABEH43_07810, partial [Flavobacteriales bacterium]